MCIQTELSWQMLTRTDSHVLFCLLLEWASLEFKGMILSGVMVRHIVPQKTTLCSQVWAVAIDDNKHSPAHKLANLHRGVGLYIFLPLPCIRRIHKWQGLQSQFFSATMCPVDVYRCLCGNEKEGPRKIDPSCSRVRQNGYRCLTGGINFYRHTCFTCRQKAKEEGREITQQIFVPYYNPHKPTPELQPKAQATVQQSTQQSIPSSAVPSQSLGTRVEEALYPSVSVRQLLGSANYASQIPFNLPTRYPNQLPHPGSHPHHGKAPAASAPLHPLQGSIDATSPTAPSPRTQHSSPLAEGETPPKEYMALSDYYPESPGTRFGTPLEVGGPPFEYIDPSKLQRSVGGSLVATSAVSSGPADHLAEARVPTPPKQPRSRTTNALLRDPNVGEHSKDYIDYCTLHGESEAVALAWYRSYWLNRHLIARGDTIA